MLPDMTRPANKSKPELLRRHVAAWRGMARRLNLISGSGSARKKTFALAGWPSPLFLASAAPPAARSSLSAVLGEIVALSVRPSVRPSVSSVPIYQQIVASLVKAEALRPTDRPTVPAPHFLQSFPVPCYRSLVYRGFAFYCARRRCAGHGRRREITPKIVAVLQEVDRAA